MKAGGNLDEIWNESFGEGSSKRNVLIASPVADSVNVYTVDAEGEVRAFALDTGKEIWEKKLKPINEEAEDASVSGAGLAIFDNNLFITTGFGEVFALNKENGETVWSKNIKSPIRIAPSVNDNLVIIQTLDNGIYALNINNGEIMWKDKLEEEAAIVSKAGLPGAITISTEMAGRGTDIKLGGEVPDVSDLMREIGENRVLVNI